MDTRKKNRLWEIIINASCFVSSVFESGSSLFTIYPSDPFGNSLYSWKRFVKKNECTVKWNIQYEMYLYFLNLTRSWLNYNMLKVPICPTTWTLPHQMYNHPPIQWNSCSAWNVAHKVILETWYLLQHTVLYYNETYIYIYTPLLHAWFLNCSY